jgi:hypothetical protein
MGKDADKNLHEEERNFLKEELKRIEDQIKAFNYDSKNIGSQERLWALREKITHEIGGLGGNTYITQYSK